jgi:glucokinase
LDTFLEFLARSNNLTLKVKATGGLLIAGDIPQMVENILIKINSMKNSRSVIKWKEC